MVQAARFYNSMLRPTEWDQSTGKPVSSGKWLTLLGGSGVGKTHLARAVFQRWMELPMWYQPFGKDWGPKCVLDGRFVDWRAQTESFQRGDYTAVDDLCDFDFVVLDDIGAEHDPSGIGKSKLDRILNSRLLKNTVITSNLMLDQIRDRLDERIASRLIRNDSVIIELTVPDFNIRTK